MTTIAPHLATATVLTVHHVTYLRSVATTTPPAQASRGVALVALAIVGVMLAAVASAARGMASMIIEFMRLAATMASALLIVVIVILIAMALLIHA